MLQKLRLALRQWYSNLRAHYYKRIVLRRVTDQLRLLHATELANTPTREWALVRQKQAEEIQATIDGRNFDIVDRRSWAWPYLPEALHRLNQPILKNTPYNLRRFSETPIPRRAINLIKNGVLSRSWQIKAMEDTDEVDPEREKRIRIATECLKRPNNTDSFRELWEAVTEDIIIGGYGAIEPRMTPFYERPLKMWAVDGSTIRIFVDWTESTPDRPRYAQMTGLKGERGIVTFLDNELIYIRDNVRTATPFGLGKLEVAFNTVNGFLSAQDMASKAGADQVHKTWLWWNTTLNPGHIQTVRRHITNELEGQAKISLMAGLQKPEVIDVKAVLPEDLLLDWQKFLIEIIANAFDLSPMSLGQTDRLNRATGQIMADADFRSAVVPMAHRIEEAINRHILHGFLKWKDLRFEFIGLEDSDAITRTVIQQREYMMDAITSDEIRETNSKAALPGGWGRLTYSQKQIIMAEAAAKVGGKAPGGGGGLGGPKPSTGGGGFGLGSTGTGTSMGSTGASLGGGGGISGSIMAFTPQEVTQMLPDEVELYQNLGLLPPTQDLMQQMEEQAPGILETVTDELQRFFEQQELLEEAAQVQPAPITPSDEKEQLTRFEESEHQESLAEKFINRRGVFSPAIDQQYRRNPERGKYPRSGGRFSPDPAQDRIGRPGTTSSTPLEDTEKKAKMPKGKYRPGTNNLYR